MKFGGISYNSSVRRKTGVLTKFVCSVCGRQYKMEHHRNVHMKLCKQYWKKWEKNNDNQT